MPYQVFFSNDDLGWTCIEPITFGFCILHKGIVSYKICTNDDPGLGLVLVCYTYKVCSNDDPR